MRRPYAKIVEKDIDSRVFIRRTKTDKSISLQKEIIHLRELESKHIKDISELKEKLSTNRLEQENKHLKFKLSQYNIHCSIENKNIQLIQCSNKIKKGICLKPCSEVTNYLRDLKLIK